MSASGQSLLREDFRLTGPNGFGDGWNHYAHSMAWFRNRLYVGTTRATMAGLKLSVPLPDMKPWPIECSEDLYSLPRCAEIWEYTPETTQWRLAFRSPTVTGVNGRPGVPSYVGYRGMTVFQARGDAEPCLYVATWSPHLAHSPDLLRTEDGQTFKPVKRPPFNPTVRSFRTVQPFQGRVHLSATATGTAKGFNQDLASEAVIYCADDLLGDSWKAASADGFGNKNNSTVFEMTVYDGHLYGGTANPYTGGELWRTRGGSLPYEWEPVITEGADRGVHNEVAGTLCEFKGALYVALGVINGGYHRAFKIGPAAAEIIRVWPDKSWDLIMGEARQTRQGLKYPLSGMTPGFDNIFNGYVWRMHVHDGWLYAATMTWAMLLPFLPTYAWPPDVSAVLRRWGVNRLTESAGFELWRTNDGIHWEPVTRDGFGNKYNWGGRTFASTPHGLFVGTANPFGPRSAVLRDNLWQYVNNPRGGCEIWLGSKSHVHEKLLGEA
ncbi:hypothetical protein SAMN04488038_103226 [Solimonas aquatica]|uniref:Uncharacterized protein n=1 Tax=Solimonas aquatica TaxID=489703 RepID=A0A1H9CY50_9GAMM|nr:hypothetical protein [Solimonas aquatica]SEQ06047.1 hypothetical protein SAMN04488038_103226 [Solimonas aquatica]